MGFEVSRQACRVFILDLLMGFYWAADWVVASRAVHAFHLRSFPRFDARNQASLTPEKASQHPLCSTMNTILDCWGNTRYTGLHRPPEYLRTLRLGASKRWSGSQAERSLRLKASVFSCFAVWSSTGLEGFEGLEGAFEGFEGAFEGCEGFEGFEGPITFTLRHVRGLAAFVWHPHRKPCPEASHEAEERG